jgi:hypothetical protein
LIEIESDTEGPTKISQKEVMEDHSPWNTCIGIIEVKREQEE